MSTHSTHSFRFSDSQHFASCSCGRWGVFNRKRNITKPEAQRDFDLHKESAQDAESYRRAKALNVVAASVD